MEHTGCAAQLTQHTDVHAFECGCVVRGSLHLLPVGVKGEQNSGPRLKTLHSSCIHRSRHCGQSTVLCSAGTRQSVHLVNTALTAYCVLYPLLANRTNCRNQHLLPTLHKKRPRYICDLHSLPEKLCRSIEIVFDRPSLGESCAQSCAGRRVDAVDA